MCHGTKYLLIGSTVIAFTLNMNGQMHHGASRGESERRGEQGHGRASGEHMERQSAQAAQEQPAELQAQRHHGGAVAEQKQGSSQHQAPAMAAQQPQQRMTHQVAPAAAKQQRAPQQLPKQQVPAAASRQLPQQPMQAPLAVPQPNPPVPPVQPIQEETQEPEGLDTIHNTDAQGNWLFKRMWWQRAETQYEKIKSVVDSIMESRMAFFAKRTEWDKTIFDPFYQDSGLGRGVLEELIGSLMNQLNQERERDGQLEQKERELLSALESQKALLEQLQKDVQKINDIDNAVDEAIAVLIQQLNIARNFERKSWENFKAIAQELNDKKARDLFYGMVTYWQNINEIAHYIQMPFLQHFEKLGAMAKDQTEKVTEALKALKEKGIDFKKQWQDLEESAMRQKNASEFKEGLEEGKAQETAEQKATLGYFDSAMQFLSDTAANSWNFVRSAGQSIWDFTIGRFYTKADAKTEKNEQHDEDKKEEVSSSATHEGQASHDTGAPESHAAHAE